MRRLPEAVPRTIWAADQLRHSVRAADSHHIGDLVLALAAVECHGSVGGPAGVPLAPPRDLVVIAARLAGNSWLKAVGGGTAVVTPLQAIWRPPPLSELDEVLAWALCERLSLPAEQPQHGTGRSVPAGQRVPVAGATVPTAEPAAAGRTQAMPRVCLEPGTAAARCEGQVRWIR